MPGGRAPSTPQSKTVGARLIESGVDPVFVDHASECRSISSRSSKDDRVSKGVIKKIGAGGRGQALAYFPDSQRFAEYLANRGMLPFLSFFFQIHSATLLTFTQ